MATLEKLTSRIEKAFAGVTLEDGVGLHETLGLDDRLSPEQCAALREKDEKHDWRKIPVIDLYRCGSCLSYFDAKGMRFHLPRMRRKRSGCSGKAWSPIWILPMCTLP